MIFYKLYDVCLYGRESGGREQEMMNGPMVFLRGMKKKRLLACLFAAMTVESPVWAADPLINQASGALSIAIGSKTDSPDSVTIGYNAKSGTNSTTIGTSGDANPTIGGDESITIGQHALTVSKSRKESLAVSIGNQSFASTGGVALGWGGTIWSK
ncbi:hypothetical protein [uncultured Dialister sp.]|jgi:hypothetical protein|uniref:hypothetical protein n=1 Tax=uncultured Dialister sp. TaxID=278064 RepID=UPI0025DDE410|nr:hypothetical protein [uncultured Dialister sp.]